MSVLVQFALHNVWMGLRKSFEGHNDRNNPAMAKRVLEIDAEVLIKGAESLYFSLHPIQFGDEHLGEYTAMWSQANGEYGLLGLYSEKQKRFISLSPMNYDGWHSVEEFYEMYRVCTEATSAKQALKEVQVDLSKYLSEVVESLKRDDQSKEGEAIKRKLNSFINEWNTYKKRKLS